MTSASDPDPRHHRVVVGVDGAPGNDAAVRYAATQAGRLGTGLHLVHVLPNYVAMSPVLPLVPDELSTTGQTILARAVSVATEILAVEHTGTTLVTGPRVSCLLQAAESALVLVVGREAPSVLERLVTGATTMGVAARASCPVVAVPPDWVPDEHVGRVVVGIRGVEGAQGLLRTGFDVASGRGATLVVVHAWELPTGYAHLIGRRSTEHEVARTMEGLLEPSLEPLRSSHPQLRVEVVILRGQPARVLAGQSVDAELLLLTRRRHGFPGAHLGGTARALLREGACPVELLPPGAGVGPDPDLELESDGTLLP